MSIRWWGRGTPQEQVANACDSHVDLTPADEVAATQTRSNWSATLPGQAVPLIWEDRPDGYRIEEDPGFC